MLPHSARPTVEILYKLFSSEQYKPNGYYCTSSEFIETHHSIKQSFIEDKKLSIQKFQITTIGAVTEN